MSKKLGIGVIGLGRLGGAYARYFTGRVAGATLVAVSDVNEVAAESLAAELGISKRYSRYQDLISDKQVKGVVIVSPTSTHKEIVLEAAKRGLAIFCEKPLSISLEEAHAMRHAVEQAVVFIQSGLMTRFDKGYAGSKR